MYQESCFGPFCHVEGLLGKKEHKKYSRILALDFKVRLVEIIEIILAKMIKKISQLYIKGLGHALNWFFWPIYHENYEKKALIKAIKVLFFPIKIV